MSPLITKITQKTGMSAAIVQSIIQLLDEGNTVPFIARYRKEMTQGATDEQLRDFHDIYMYTKNLEARKLDIIRLIDEKGLLTPSLQADIEAADTLARVEDLYRPFKEKKNTKATIAKYRGLEPLAALLKKGTLTQEAFIEEAKKLVPLVIEKRQSLVGDERTKADELFSKYVTVGTTAKKTRKKKEAEGS